MEPTGGNGALFELEGTVVVVGRAVKVADVVNKDPDVVALEREVRINGSVVDSATPEVR